MSIRLVVSNLLTEAVTRTTKPAPVVYVVLTLAAIFLSWKGSSLFTCNSVPTAISDELAIPKKSS